MCITNERLSAQISALLCCMQGKGEGPTPRLWMQAPPQSHTALSSAVAGNEAVSSVHRSMFFSFRWVQVMACDPHNGRHSQRSCVQRPSSKCLVCLVRTSQPNVHLSNFLRQETCRFERNDALFKRETKAG